MLEAVSAEKDSLQGQRDLLTIAGFHVGDGDWQAAKQIYEQLKSSPYSEVVFAVARNLDVVDRNQAIQAEPDTAQREWLQIQLAGVHQNYGHDQAAKRLLRSLQASATQEDVRRDAAQRLANYTSAPLSNFRPKIDKP